jgi:hypothetical protein
VCECVCVCVSECVRENIEFTTAGRKKIK